MSAPEARLEHLSALARQFVEERDCAKRLDGHLFAVDVSETEGEAAGSEEVHPLKWFSADELPMDEMWPDNGLWLKELLEKRQKLGGEAKMTAWFLYEDMGKVKDSKVEWG